jgi:betaine-homocysteine S-methyltransferase
VSETKLTKTQGLLERLAAGEVLCAEGYLFELERRGYLQAGAFVPEAVLDHPEAVTQLHREFVRAGSDVVEAFTYYGHREKLRLIGKEHLLEPLQRAALALAQGVAAEFPEERPLVAGNICNTNVYEPGSPASSRDVRAMFDEQVAWAAEAGVDYIIAETLEFHGEAALALEAVKASGLPAVVTLAIHRPGVLRDEVGVEESCARLADAGADVVGLNCARGPASMLPLLERVRRSVSGPLAALPVPYRTTTEQPTFQSLQDPGCSHVPTEGPFPTALDPFVCTRYEMAEFARRATALGVRYLGVCCGGAPHHVRSMAEALGRKPLASRYSPDLSKHYALGSDASLKEINLDYADRL